MKKQKYRLQKDLTLFTFSLFVIIAVWVSFTIYHSHVTSTISDVLQIRIEPITGRFDTATIDKLRTRTPVEPDFASPFGTESATAPSITPTEVPPPEEEPTPTVSENAEEITAEPTPEEETP